MQQPPPPPQQPHHQQPQQPYYQQPQQVPPPAAGGGGGCLKGCLIVLVIVLVLGAVGAFFLYRALPGFMADGLRTVTVHSVENSGLDEQQQEQLIEEIDRAAEAIRDRRLSLMNDVFPMFDRLEQQGMFAYIGLLTVHEEDLTPALEDDQQAIEEGRRQIDRVGQGLREDAIAPRQVDQALEGYFIPQDWEPEDEDFTATPQIPRRWMPREPLTADQAREVTAALEELANEADVPEQVEPRDVAAEVREQLDQALNEQ